MATPFSFKHHTFRLASLLFLTCSTFGFSQTLQKQSSQQGIFESRIGTAKTQSVVTNSAKSSSVAHLKTAQVSSELNTMKIKPASWEAYNFDEGAFSISLPGEPKDVSVESPNPLDPEGEPYLLHMYNVMDIENNDNFLFRYNDLPNGYYLEDPEEAYSSMYENMTSNGTVVSEPKVIFLDGYEGREYEVKLRHKYHTFIRIYVRGNRTYLLLYQKLNETDKANIDSPFFTRFKFTDYKDSKTETYQIEGTKIEFESFGDVKSIVDEEDYDTSYLKFSKEYLSTNPNTGDVYHFSYGELQEYFKTNDLDEFYDLNLEILKSWNDTIVDKHTIEKGDYKGIEAKIKSKNSNSVAELQIWIQNNYLFMFMAYTALEEHNKAITKSIFDSYKNRSKPSKFDIYSSKTSKLIKNLTAKDSITRNRAIGAFDYYEFDPEDVETLHQAISQDYGDEDTNTMVKDKILSEFYSLNNENTLSVVKSLYEDSKSSEEFKSNILSLMHQIDDDNALSDYLDLLFNDPPKEIDEYNWQMLSPLRDSTQLALANYQNILKLNANETYRSFALGVSADIIEEKIDSSMILNNNIDKLMVYTSEDLSKYLEAVEDTLNYDYTYNSRIYNYLRLMKTSLVDKSLTDTFTEKLIDRKDNDWFKTNAAQARIENDLPIQQELLSSMMDSMSSRFRIIKSLHKVNRLNEVPSNYIDHDNMVKLSLYDYLEDDDYYGFEISILGTLKDGENLYYSASVNYEYDDTIESYLALVGPVYKVSQSKEFELYPVEMDWDELSEDWKSQAEQLLKAVEEDD